MGLFFLEFHLSTPWLKKIPAGSLISVHYSPQLTLLTETGWFLKAKLYFILVKDSI